MICRMKVLSIMEHVLKSFGLTFDQQNAQQYYRPSAAWLLATAA